MDEIKQLKISNKAYPQILKEISDPPKFLYYRGNLTALNYPLALAVVGTRRCSEYGRQAVRTIVKDLAQAGLTIISGMARGIDTEAHRSALEHRTPTIAILGSGIDDKSIYPQQNLKLAHAIIEAGGLIMSEYEEGRPGLPHQFPERNRIVAGLSQGTLVVEAPMKSGSRITARLALEYNRDVFVVPGSIFSRLHEGSHWILQQGAKCVTNGKEILEEYEIALEKQHNAPAELTKNEQGIFELIEGSPEAVHIDKIIQETKLGAIELSQILTSLMMRGIIREGEPNAYLIKR